MASYFELPPSQNAEAAAASSIRAVPEAERKQLGKMSLMSPAVSQLLEDLGNDDSDSSEDNKSLSEDGAAEVGPKKLKSESSGPPRQDENTQSKEEPERRKPSALSPSRTAAPKPNQGKASSGHVKSLSTRNSDAGSSSKKQKPAHIARFHSLRSMLFQANIQDKMKTVTKEDCQKKEDAADRWRNQHEQRQMHRPKTPEKEHVEKDGLGSRIKGKIRRMTSKEVPTLQNIGEDSGAVGTFDDRASTASSDLEDDIRHPEWKDEDGDSESIDHSDVEELVRWVSRRDPPSDGEKRKNKVVHTELVEDSGHESLGHSDVDDLVRWVSRRSDVPDSNTKPMSDNHHTGYSDASTESDSEVARQSSDEEDADDLVRWISHRDGPKAGPVRRKLERAELDSEVEQHYDSDVPELGRWIKRHDATSGESAASSPVRGESAGFSNNCDVEEEEEEEEERGRPRSRDSHSSTKLTKNHLTHEDVDELVRWVSRKDSKAQEQSTLENDDRTLEWKRQEDEKKKKEQLGMSMDDGSLSHGDVQELVEHAKGVEVKDTLGVTGLNAAINTASTTITTEEGRGDGASDVANIQATEQAKKKDLGMSLDEGSLSHSDVQDLIAHVRKDSSSPQNDTFNKTGAGERDVVESGHARGSLDEQDVNELVRWVSTRQ